MSEERIVAYGHDLVADVIGRWSFPEFAYAALTGGQRPSKEHARMFDALLTTFVDHGVTPSSLVTRLTLLGAPEAMQGAIAAGLCGAGSRYLGTMQHAGEMLVDAFARHGRPSDATGLDGVAARVVDEHRAAGRHIPGLGHPEHKQGDPRTPRLLEIARETGTSGEHCGLMLAIAEAQARTTSHQLPLNAAGLTGAIVVDMGLPPAAGRGIAIIARAAGLAGAALSEMSAPAAQSIWDMLR